MTSKNISGTEIAKHIKEDVKHEVMQLTSKGFRPPLLAVIQIGDDPASNTYISNKRKACRETGIIFDYYHFTEYFTQEDLINLILRFNRDHGTDGILVQLPLPEGFNTDFILDTIKPDKDVDGFHPISMGKLMAGTASLKPCTPYGVMELLKETQQDLTGLHAVVIGRSNIVGKPIAMELLNENCTVTMTHSKTKDLPSLVKQADIVIAAVGIPNFVKSDWVKEDAIVIDVGINRVEGKLVGDVDYHDVYDKVKYITPVPGGVGPVTVAMLMKNTLTAYRLNNQKINKKE